MSQAVKSRRADQDARRTAILDAAAEVFFEQGYAAASIDAVIERIGGSKRNIYSMFGSKEGLFIALVTENARRLFDPLVNEGTVHKDLRETLTDFAIRLLHLFMSRRMAGVYRVVVSEAARLPDLAASFYRNGPDLAASWVADILAQACARGEIQVDDPKLAAQRFMGILRGNLYMEIVLDLSRPMDSAEIDNTARSAVDLFLNGVKTKS